MPFIDVDTQTRINYRIHGEDDGDTVLLISPSVMNILAYDGLATTLAGNGYRVISYDHRGIGDSQRGAGPISVETLAQDALSVLDSLEVGRAHVVGWSLGSAVAQRLASTHPTRVASLVLYATWAHAGYFQQAVLTGLRHAWASGDMNEGLSAMALVFSPQLLGSEAFPSVIQSVMATMPATSGQIATVVEQLDAARAHDGRGHLGEIVSPTLIVGGEQDLLTPLDGARSVAAAIRGSETALLTGPGSSHGLMMERVEEFESLILGFLAKH